MAIRRKIVIVDDEIEMLENCARILEKLGHTSVSCNNSEQVLQVIKTEKPDLVLTDLKMPKKSGLEIVQEVREFNPELPIIVITGYASIESAVNAMKAGAFDYLPKPFTLDQFRLTIERALRQVNLSEENQRLKSELQQAYQFDNIVGLSPAMHRVFESIRKVAKSDANVLVLGESGTGKELVARSLHINSNRANRPFIPVDCVSLPEQLLESELFGYERGAFTGANSTKPGLFELAHQGTVFLDEIGDLSKGLQAKLLRVLQERQFRRIGSTTLINVDMRIIAATNRDLSQMVKEGEFREDLYYRLNVISIPLPPLRERTGDVALLAQHFCQKFSTAQGKDLKFSSATLTALESYHWPGNIRELRNVIERAVTVTDNQWIELKDLPLHMMTQQNSLSVNRLNQENESHELLPFTEAKQEWIALFEQRYLTKLLSEHNGNISRAADAAGIDRRTIHRLLKKYGFAASKLDSNE